MTCTQRRPAVSNFSVMSLVLVDHPRPEVAVLTMNRPDRLNAMSIELVDELYDALSAAGDDNTCRADRADRCRAAPSRPDST